MLAIWKFQRSRLMNLDRVFLREINRYDNNIRIVHLNYPVRPKSESREFPLSPTFFLGKPNQHLITQKELPRSGPLIIMLTLGIAYALGCKLTS